MLWKKLNREGRLAVFIRADTKTHWQGNIWVRMWRKWRKELCIYLMMSIPGRGKVSVIAQRQEPGSIAGPIKEKSSQRAGVEWVKGWWQEIGSENSKARGEEWSRGHVLWSLSTAPVWEFTRGLSDCRILSCVTTEIFNTWVWIKEPPFHWNAPIFSFFSASTLPQVLWGV